MNLGEPGEPITGLVKPSDENGSREPPVNLFDNLEEKADKLFRPPCEPRKDWELGASPANHKCEKHPDWTHGGAHVFSGPATRATAGALRNRKVERSAKSGWMTEPKQSRDLFHLKQRTRRREKTFRPGPQDGSHESWTILSCVWNFV